MQRSKTSRRAIPLALGIAALVILSAVTVTRASQNAALQAATATPAATQPASEASADASTDAFLTINPEAGFPLDPFLVSLQGGGPVDASTVSDQCSGFVAEAPAVTVDYQGEADLLRAFFLSDGDTTLVVETPDGEFLCNDDAYPVLLDASVEISKPVQGLYNVWVGSAVAQDLVPGFLVFTTHENVTAATMALADLVQRPPLPAVLPRLRQANAAARLADALENAEAEALEAGGDDVTVDVTADGDLPVPEMLTSDQLCSGVISLAPSYAFDWSGETETLSLYVEAEGDTTLLVRAPDGSLLCADDADGADNLNPLVTISAPADGRYLVWVGRIDPSEPVSGTLTITEAADAQPAAAQ